MQISSINSTLSFNAKKPSNQSKIRDLEQKRVMMQAMSEGFNAGLSSKDEYELKLRREYQGLCDKHHALQWGTEGCTGGLCSSDLHRMQEIREILDVITPKETECRRVSVSTGYEDNRPDDIRYWNY